MVKWNSRTREALKRELMALGYFKGPVQSTWDGDARASVDKYLAAGR